MFEKKIETTFKINKRGGVGYDILIMHIYSTKNQYRGSKFFPFLPSVGITSFDGGKTYKRLFYFLPVDFN